MPQYKYVGGGEYHDHRNDRVLEADEVAEFAEEIGENSPVLELVEEPGSSDATGGVNEPKSGETTPENVDYSELSYNELRTMASEAETDEIDGRSSKEEIIAFFESE